MSYTTDELKNYIGDEAAIIDAIRANYILMPNAKVKIVSNMKDAFLACAMKNLGVEQAWILACDGQDNLLAKAPVGLGSTLNVCIDTKSIVRICSIHPNCSQAWLIHTHPAKGKVSRSDNTISSRIKDLLASIQVLLRESIVVIGNVLHGVLRGSKITL